MLWSHVLLRVTLLCAISFRGWWCCRVAWPLNTLSQARVAAATTYRVERLGEKKCAHDCDEQRNARAASCLLVSSHGVTLALRT